MEANMVEINEMETSKLKQTNKTKTQSMCPRISILKKILKKSLAECTKRKKKPKLAKLEIN